MKEMRVLLAIAALAACGNAIPGNPTHFDKWTVQEVAEFVRQIGDSPKWSTIADQFEADQYDGLVFEALKTEDLEELGIPKPFAKPLIRKRDEEKKKRTTSYSKIWAETRSSRGFTMNSSYSNNGNNSNNGNSGNNGRRRLVNDPAADGLQGQCLATQVLGLTDCNSPCRNEFDAQADAVDENKQVLTSLSQEVTQIRQSGLMGDGNGIVWSDTNQVWKYQQFENGLDGWTERNSVTPVQDCSTSFEGQCSLRFPRAWGRNFENGTNNEATPLTPASYPYLCFAYKLPPSTELNLLVLTGSGWSSIVLTKGLDATCNDYDYPKIGQAELKQDNKWNHFCYDLRDAVGDNTQILGMIWHWPHSNCGNSSDANVTVIANDGLYPHPDQQDTAEHTFWIDAFSVTSEKPQLPNAYRYETLLKLQERVISLEQSLANVRYGRSEPGVDWPDSANFYKWQTFENGLDGWSERNGVAPVQDCTYSYEGNCSIRFDSAWGRNFEGVGVPFSPSQYPYICFAYRVPRATMLNMLVHVPNDGGWKSIVMNKALYDRQCTYDYARIGFMEPGLQQDDEWHYKCYDVRQATTENIDALIWHWPGGDCSYPDHSSNADAAVHTFWIDAFAITDSLPVGYTLDGSH